MVTPATAILTPSPRPGGLLSVTLPLEGAWERGLYVFAGSVLSPDRVGPCPVESGEPQPPGGATRFDPVVVRLGVLCSAMGRPDVTGLADAAVEATAAWALSAELYDGAATGNPSLVDAVDLGEAVSVTHALGLLEEDADQALSGRLAVIHVPVGLSSYLGDMVYRDGNVWRTKAGNLVAIHGQGNTAYVTGQVWSAFTTVESTEYTNPGTNITEGWSDVLALVAFDPDYIASIGIPAETSSSSPTPPASSPTSPTDL